MSASTQEQINALPARGTSALRKKALLENQIQREQAEADRLERLKEVKEDKRLKEKTLRKKKANRPKIINKYVNGGKEEDAKVMEEKDKIGEDKKRVGEKTEIMVEEVDSEEEVEEKQEDDTQGGGCLPET